MKLIIQIFMVCLVCNSLWATTLIPQKRSAGVVLKDPAPGGFKGIYLSARCYGTNNRGTTNPLSPKSSIYVGLAIGGSKTTSASYVLKFPGAMAKSGANVTTGCGYRIVSKSEAKNQNPKAAYLKATTCKNNFMKVTLSKLNIVGNDKYRIAVSSKQDFNDSAYNNPRAFYGYNGYMGRGAKHNVRYVNTKDRYGNPAEYLKVIATYPGQDGYCGGFHSPLMLFFDYDNKKPKFNGETTLLRKGGAKTYWTEKNHVGYYLALLDEKKPEKGIYKAEQLFGDGNNFPNGFSALSAINSKHDEVIDAKDKAFKHLVLWKDIDGNGKSSPDELTKLSEKGITKINLDYNDRYFLEFGNYAAAEGRGVFTMKRLKKVKKVRK